MKKIPTVLVRDPEDRALVTQEITPGCEWVFDGAGVATAKWDGTCVLLDNAGLWWARREVKPGKRPPAGFRPVQLDDGTGKVVGWVPIEDSPFAAIHAEALDVGALDLTASWDPDPGTYELIGPRINQNPQNAERHRLVRHGVDYIPQLDHPSVSTLAPSLFRYAFAFEGVVWHHPDGRMAKIKHRDFSHPAYVPQMGH